MLAQHEEVAEYVADGAADERAVEDQPTFPKPEELGPRLIVLVHEGEPSPDDAAEDDPHSQVLDVLGRDPFLARSPARQPDAEKQGDHQHRAEAVDGNA